jgi:hypothetical protein
VNINREGEIARLLKDVFAPVVASSEFRERLLERLPQEISRQALQPPTAIQDSGEGSA